MLQDVLCDWRRLLSTPLEMLSVFIVASNQRGRWHIADDFGIATT